MSVSTTTQLRSAVASIPNPLPHPVSVAGKFLLCGTVGQIAWIMLLISLGGGELKSSTTAETASTMSVEAVLFFGALTLPALVVGGVYTTLPDETVDLFHRFGKGSALFFALNVSLSSSFVVWEVFYQGPITGPIHFLASWAIASIFLPGIYVGCLVAARWAR